MTPAADVLPQALHSVERKQFLEFARKSHAQTMQRTARHSRSDESPNIFRHLKSGAAVRNVAVIFAPAPWRSLLNMYPNQSSRALMDPKSASPTIARDELLPVEWLLVTPKHIDSRSRRFFPAQIIIVIPFP